MSHPVPSIGASCAACRDTLQVDGDSYGFFSLERFAHSRAFSLEVLPVALRILLENLLRNHDGQVVTDEHLEAIVRWPLHREPGGEVPFHPVRIVMPDSSGIPMLADLAAMRDAMVALGGSAGQINPTVPLDLVVDHTVAVDVAGQPDAAARNLAREYQRNDERYRFLRWAQSAFRNLTVVPPGNGILHQINLERLARVVWTVDTPAGKLACPDAIVGMDSHTAMVNAMGVLGWGVGGIEATTAMLGQAISIQLPRVVGCRLVGRLRPGVTTTDLVLTLTQRLREHGVVGAFVEFCGEGIATLTLPERATLSNMCPEYGSTTTLFPIDRETIRYLAVTGRSAHQLRLVEAYARQQGLWRDEGMAEPSFSSVMELDLGAVEPSVAGPRQPGQRVPLHAAPASFEAVLAETGLSRPPVQPREDRPLTHGDVVIAAITSCTNTSNPNVMLAAGLLARNAVARGLRAKPWVKTSLAPGSQVVADYLQAAGLQAPLDTLGFHLAGFGCTTCMGNSGPLAAPVAEQITSGKLVVSAVLSGNRNFESRIHPLARTNYLASPPLVVAYAIAGTMLVDLTKEALGHDPQGRPVFLADLWPSDDEVREAVGRHVTAQVYSVRYAGGYAGASMWESLPAHGGVRFGWDPASRFILRPPFFGDMPRQPKPLSDIRGARALAVLGDNLTTDHISPISHIPADSAAGSYLLSLGIRESEFGSYMERRVNHDVMVRGTFANTQLRNELVPGRQGGMTRLLPGDEVATIHAAAEHYARAGVPLVVVGGANYGAGSSRDWAAKGTALLGVRAVIAESYERIHRSNLIGMGVMPLQFTGGQTRKSLQLDGTETYDIAGLADHLAPGKQLTCRVTRADSSQASFELLLRLDTPREVEWALHGGMLRHALRLQLEP